MLICDFGMPDYFVIDFHFLNTYSQRCTITLLYHVTATAVTIMKSEVPQESNTKQNQHYFYYISFNLSAESAATSFNTHWTKNDSSFMRIAVFSFAFFFKRNCHLRIKKSATAVHAIWRSVFPGKNRVKSFCKLMCLTRWDKFLFQFMSVELAWFSKRKEIVSLHSIRLKLYWYQSLISVHM